MTTSAKADWLIPAGLIALSLVPAAAGTFRIIQLGGGAEITPANARFFAAPLPVVLHIVSSVIFCVLGAFQFAAEWRRRNPNWHRVGGRVLIPCGLVAALSALWMNQFYPRSIEDFDNELVYAMRLLAGSAMALFLCLGFTAIRRGDIRCHRAWMLRGYALGLGAGTQVLTHIPWFLFPSIQGETARALFTGAGWAINLAVAEWSISRERRRQFS
ncbi:DUF2306 domain-containing protein [Variovorax paradoxus]|nr:DUF2306 domain-containing protein [Variovorax paradoxus]MBT2305378.1 DUF2306 domain-containing protein [Variovorax paradoxus]